MTVGTWRAHAVCGCLASAVTALVLAACAGQLGGRPSGGPSPGRPGSPDASPQGGPSAESIKAYQRAGLIAEAGQFPFVGHVAYFAGRSPDSTIVFITLSFANRALTFRRENGVYRATYDSRVDLTPSDGSAPRHIEGSQSVVVGTYPETSRQTESVIFQAALNAPPGSYQLSIYLHDQGSMRAVTKQIPATVPRLGPPSLSTPVAVYEATPRTSVDSAPHLVVSPRSTVTFGRDSAVDVYIEGYGDGAELPVDVTIRSDTTTTLWTESVTLPRHGALFSGVAVVPVSRIGIGTASLVFRRSASRAGGSTGDSVWTPVFVGFGEDLPVASFDEMLDYLKYFPNRTAVDSLRHAPPDQRAAAWTRFLRETQNEALQSYFNRLRQANERFRDEGIPGWQTDRGMVFITLGEPDQIYLQGSLNVNVRGREQVWVYRQYNAQLVFVDQTGLGRYRLTPRSMADYQSILRRIEKERAKTPPPQPPPPTPQGR
jgi:GWxTD domain-containing protein